MPLACEQRHHALLVLPSTEGVHEPLPSKEQLLLQP
jgi:hypothetical protein